MVIVGESGSGKTTLLRLIAGLEDPDEGEIWLHDEKVLGSAYNLIPGHASIKLLAQDFNLLPRHKVAENIAYYLRWYSAEAQQKRIEELLAWCKLSAVAHRYPAELSGGQQQRTALAVALADEPLLLLLDEPFSQLDTPTKRQLRTDTHQILKQAGIGALVVTHDIQDAFFLADKIGIMQQGNLLQVATPQEIYQQPATPYVAELFGNANCLLYNQLQPLLQYYDPHKAQQMAMVRYENLQIVDERLIATSTQQQLQPQLQHQHQNYAKAVVQSCRFLGSHYEVTVVLVATHALLILYSRKVFEEQAMVKVWLVEQKMVVSF